MGSDTRRPHVVTHSVASVDGRTAISPGVLLMVDRRWPTGDVDPYDTVRQRHHPQALLEGSGSFVAPDAAGVRLPGAPEPATELFTDHVPDTVRARATQGWFTVVDSRGRVRWQYKEFPGKGWAGWHLLVLVAERTPPAYLSYLRREGIPYLVVGRDHVDLTLALRRMQSLLHVRTVVSTAGGRLNGALLRAGMVDEVEVEVVPMLVGGTTTPALFTAPDLSAEDHPTTLDLVQVERGSGGRVLLRYQVADR